MNILLIIICIILAIIGLVILILLFRDMAMDNSNDNWEYVKPGNRGDCKYQINESCVYEPFESTPCIFLLNEKNCSMYVEDNKKEGVKWNYYT